MTGGARAEDLRRLRQVEVGEQVVADGAEPLLVAGPGSRVCRLLMA